MGTLPNAQTVLREYFGYNAFREGQEPLIHALLHGQDALGIMPTGAGKSLCYQIPALIFPGITLVISPLLSLMKDQVNTLTQNGIPAAFLNSALTPGQYHRALQNAWDGQYKIIYVAPERLLNEEFLSFALAKEISFVSVDEAHCLSQWGQDFRPSYLKIIDFLSALPKRPIVGAFTATATERVRDDIIQLLGLQNPLVVTTGFDRPNLYFEVKYPQNKLAELTQFLAGHPGQNGIIYCIARKTVEQVCQRLQALETPATRYHAGLSMDERKSNQEAFLTDQSQVMVATNAFGMGIDKSNVSFVVHYNMPKNLESYYQEAGRAGRDGLPATCVLYYAPQDVRTQQFLTERSAMESEELDAAAKQVFLEAEAERLRQMMLYCHTTDCLRGYILQYFGEKPLFRCDNCYNCLHGVEKTDVTIEAQKILSCIKRMGERFGQKMVIDVLRGSKNERLLQLGLDNVKTYGALSGTSEQHVREIIRFLTAENYLAVEMRQEKFPILKWTERSQELLVPGASLVMGLSKPKEKTQKKQKREIPTEILRPDLFEKLRSLRSQIANRQGVPAYVVFNDAALRDMCAVMPQTLAEFATVNGVGEAKLKRYGKEFLRIITEHPWGEQT